MSLSRVDLPVDDTLKNTLESLKLSEMESLLPVDEMQEVFDKPPQHKHLHIVILHLQLNCFVLGDSSNIFRVNAVPKQTVSDLKGLIKDKRTQQFDHIDADNIQLLQLQVKVDVKNLHLLQVDTIGNKGVQLPEPFIELSKVFADGVKLEYIHIVARHPGITQGESIEDAYLSAAAKSTGYSTIQANMTAHSRSYPTPVTYLRDKSLVRFKYERSLECDPSCVTYLARTEEVNPINVVVKFVTRYGEDVHNAMAEAGFAPKLFYYGKIDVVEGMPSYGGLRMVVMEYVDGVTAHSAPQLPPSFHQQLTKAIEHCHRKGFVFGDLRKPNVMITKDGKVQLIDFDWAGREGKVTYPVSISPAIVWPEGVQRLGPILKQHDDMMCRFMCPLEAAVEEAAKDNAAREKQSASLEEHRHASANADDEQSSRKHDPGLR